MAGLCKERKPMCGFAGFYGPENIDKEKIIKLMADRIAHRGPDSEGLFMEDDVAMGFRRLSIIDLSGGTQPLHSGDDRYVITFNGEIYNYKDLRAELKEEFGTEFVTDSDTETIIEVYRHFGEATAEKLRGMFSFVIYDRVEKSLYGARDYFGIKPFYYTYVGKNLVYGSEIKSFLDYPGFRKEINPDALKMYLVFQYSPLEESIFKGVYKLPQGTYFTYKNGELKTVRYFETSFDPRERSFDEAVEKIDAVVEESVRYHKIADVEVGGFLSGGVDSSYITSVARPEKTYSVGFNIEGFDETSLAGGLSKILGISNKIREITPEEFFDALPKVQYYSDEPHSNLSAVPLYFLSELAAKEVKVVLSGEGADEFFGGYDWYIESEASRKYRKLPQGLRNGLAKTLGKIPQSHIKRFFRENAKSVEDTYIGQAFIMGDKEANYYLAPEYKRDITFKDVTKPFYDKVRDKDDLTKKMYLDMNLWLVGDILLKADKMTMAHSLELRVPYLDKEVWNLARTLTTEQKMKGRETKRAFRKAASRHIPEEWYNRKKAGFMVPFRKWIREEKFAARVREYFNKDYAAQFFDVKKLNKLLQDHLSGERNNGRKIYTIYSFLLWYEQYFIIND